MPNPNDTAQPDNKPKRGAIWCNTDDIEMIRKAATLRGQTMRQYMADIAELAREHANEAAQRFIQSDLHNHDPERFAAPASRRHDD